MQGYFYDTRKINSLEFGTVLEIRFNGCNFDCIFCSNPEYKHFNQEYLKDIQNIKKEIQYTDTIIFSGGEPSIQHSVLLELLTFSKKNLKTTILKTNLTKPNLIETILEKDLLDIIIIETFPFYEEKFKKITGIRNYFVKTKEIIYDIINSLMVLKKNNIEKGNLINSDIGLYLNVFVIPGILYSKKEIFEMIDFYLSFLAPKKIILNPIMPEILEGRFRNLNPLSVDYINQLSEDILSNYNIDCIIEK